MSRGLLPTPPPPCGTPEVIPIIYFPYGMQIVDVCATTSTWGHVPLRVK